MSDVALGTNTPDAAIDLTKPASWPVISPVAVITATDEAAQRSIIKPMLTAVGLMSANLLTYSDDKADALYASDPLAAARIRREMATFAREVTSYFAANISCFTIGQAFAPEEVATAQHSLLHGVTVACKHAPDLLQDSNVAGAVAQGFENYHGMSPAARHDQRVLVDMLITQLTQDKFGDVPAHMETLAHQVNKWGREALAADKTDVEDISPSPGSRAQALARIILNRAGRSDEHAEGILTHGSYERPAVA